MERQSFSFEGGLKTRLQPHYLEPNQAVTAQNCDVDSGALKALNGLGSSVSSGPTKSIYKDAAGSWIHSSQNRSYVPWLSQLMYSKDDSGATPVYPKLRVGASEYALGITPPASAMSVAGVRQFLDRIVMFDSQTGASYDYTTQAQSPDEDDVEIFPADPHTGDYIEFADADQFSAVVFDLTTAGSGRYRVKWQYSVEGAKWGGLSLLPTVTQVVKRFKELNVHYVAWTLPSDWAKHGAYYKVRAKIKRPRIYKSQPRAGMMWKTDKDAGDIITDGVGLTGHFKYKLTYRTSRGVKSAPYLPGQNLIVELDVKSVSSIRLTSIPVPPVISDEMAIVKKRLSRTPGDGEDYYLVAELNTSASQYEDSLMDFNLLANEPYDEDENHQPIYQDLDGDGTYTRVQPKFLKEHNGLFWLVVGDKLYWSRPLGPHYWPVLNFLDFDSTITGLGEAGPDLIVVTSRKGVYRVSGNTESTIYKTKLPAVFSCVSQYSMFEGVASQNQEPEMSNFLIWASDDGIIVFDGATAKNITEDALGTITIASCHGKFQRGRYYLFQSSETLIADFRFGAPHFRKANVTGESSYFDPSNDTIYLGANSLVKAWNAGSALTYSYKTGEFTAPAAIEKQKVFDGLEISFNGDVTVTLYIDGTSVSSEALSSVSRKREKVFFPAYQVGQAAQIGLSGTAEIYSMTLFYVVDIFEKVYHARRVRVTYQGSIALSMHLDGSQLWSKNLSSTKRKSEWLYLPPGSIGNVFQHRFTQQTEDAIVQNVSYDMIEIAP